MQANIPPELKEVFEGLLKRNIPYCVGNEPDFLDAAFEIYTLGQQVREKEVVELKERIAQLEESIGHYEADEYNRQMGG